MRIAIIIQMKHLFSFNSLKIIWSRFSLIKLYKLPGKPFLVRNLYLTCSDTGLLHFSRKIIFQVWFLKVSDENGEKCHQRFQSYKKRISSMIVFIILLLSRNLRLHRKWFSGANKEKKTTNLREMQADWIF